MAKDDGIVLGYLHILCAVEFELNDELRSAAMPAIFTADRTAVNLDDLAAMRKRGGVSFHGAASNIAHLFRSKWLGQIIDGAQLHRLNGRFVGGVGRDDDDGNGSTAKSAWTAVTLDTRARSSFRVRPSYLE